MSAERPFVSAVIVGAGSGTRMGGVNKALIKIGEKTAFRMVLEAFESASCIDEVVVVCRSAAELEEESAFFAAKPLKFAAGGATRADSVKNGIAAASARAAFYCIHDCARPLVTPAIIESAVSAAFEKGAAAVCTPVTDTVKYVNGENGTVYTPERKHLFAVQTPQVFEAKMYTASLAVAKRDRYVSTDDTSIVEHAGFKVQYVETDGSNIKLTKAEDVFTARFIEQRRRKERLK